MSMQLFLKAISAQFGTIAGDSTVPGHVGDMRVIGFKWGLRTPIDPATGLPSGRKVLDRLIVTKLVDRGSPGLLQSEVTNAIFSSVTLVLARFDKVGTLVNFFSFVLENARAVQLDYSGAEGGLDSPTEEIQFTFQRLTMAYAGAGGIVSTIVDASGGL
jgi:type VI secretion system secreted protein Hcp